MDLGSKADIAEIVVALSKLPKLKKGGWAAWVKPAWRLLTHLFGSLANVLLDSKPYVLPPLRESDYTPAVSYTHLTLPTIYSV